MRATCIVPLQAPWQSIAGAVWGNPCVGGAGAPNSLHIPQHLSCRGGGGQAGGAGIWGVAGDRGAGREVWGAGPGCSAPELLGFCKLAPHVGVGAAVVSRSLAWDLLLFVALRLYLRLITSRWYQSVSVMAPHAGGVPCWAMN